jgi:hypothetical protein
VATGSGLYVDTANARLSPGSERTAALVDQQNHHRCNPAMAGGRRAGPETFELVAARWQEYWKDWKN